LKNENSQNFRGNINLEEILSFQDEAFQKLREINETSILLHSSASSLDDTLLHSLKDSFSKMSEMLKDIQNEISSFDKLRSENNNSMQASLTNTEETNISVSESLVSLNMISQIFSRSFSQAKTAAIEIRATMDNGRMLSRLANNLTQDFKVFQSNIEELDSNTKKSGDLGKQSTAIQNQLASHSQAASKNIEEVLSSMDKIKEQVHETERKISELSKKVGDIGQIVDVIVDISEQTNLLALNASIEAARAGEHGKGFAVVAEDIRKLAERSSSATRDIFDRIESMESDMTVASQSIGESTKLIIDGVSTSVNLEHHLKFLREQIGSLSRQSNSLNEELARTKSLSQGAIYSVREMGKQVLSSNDISTQVHDRFSEVEGILSNLLVEMSTGQGALTTEVNRLLETGFAVGRALASIKKIRDLWHLQDLRASNLKDLSENLIIQAHSGTKQSEFCIQFSLKEKENFSLLNRSIKELEKCVDKIVEKIEELVLTSQGRAS
jgi:methyl-accepting chemotaxis protein